MGLTRKRDLRSGKAVWTAYRHANIPASRLERSTHTEVVVVGAGTTGALVSQALTAGFLQDAMRHGARFHAPHEVTDLRTDRTGVTLSTRGGVEVHARHVVLCTGYELPKIAGTGKQNHLYMGHATRTQQQHIWPQRALIWEASAPYLYVRSTHDGRVICGGEDEEFSDSRRRDLRNARKTSRLEHKVGKLLPRVDARAAFAWTGCFGASRTGCPTIGEIPGYPHCYAALGYGGNGITFSMLAATLLTAAICGKHDPDARLFAFD